MMEWELNADKRKGGQTSRFQDSELPDLFLLLPGISCAMQSTVFTLIKLPEKAICNRAEVFL